MGKRYPTLWLRISGKKLLPVATIAFIADEFTGRNTPGFLTFVYAAGCGFHPHNPAAAGLAGLARRLSAPLHKLSATTQADPEMLRDDSLGAWLDSPDEIRHCAMAGLDPDTIRRHSAYSFNGAWRKSVANEIYFFRPQTFDVDRLIRICEVIVYRHTVEGSVANTSWLSRGQGFRKVLPTVPSIGDCRNDASRGGTQLALRTAPTLQRLSFNRDSYCKIK